MLTGDYESWGGAWQPSALEPGQALREPRPLFREARSRAGRRRRARADGTRRRSVIDTHAHLDALEDPGAAVARAREAGVTRVITIGTGIESCRAALAIAEQHDGVYAALGIDPHQAATDEAQPGRRAARAARPPSVRSPWARPASTTTTAPRRRTSNAASSRRSSSSRASSGLPVVVHTRDGERRHRGDPRARTTARSSCTASRSRACSRPALERGWYFSFAGNVTYPKAAELREAAAAVPADRILAETDSPYLAPQPLRGRPNEPAHVVHTRRRARRRPRRGRRRARGADRRERDRRLLAAVTVIPKKRLGQHFLADENILGVIGRLAELGADDVVLEIGPGPRRPDALPRGPRRATSTPSSSTARSRRTSASWRSARTSTSTGATRSRSTSPRSSRTPTKLVANLPYNVATPIVAESLDRAAQPRALVRDGAARGRRPLLRRALDEGVRRRVGADPARRPPDRLPSGRPHRLPAAAERRLGARRLPAGPAAGALRPDQGRRRGVVRAPAQDAAELARARRTRRARAAPPPRSRRSAGSPKRGPRRSSRRSSSRSPRRCDEGARARRS